MAKTEKAAAPSLQRNMVTILARGYVNHKERGHSERATHETVTVSAVSADGLPLVGLESNNFSATQCHRVTGGTRIVPIRSVKHLESLGNYEIDIDLFPLDRFGLHRTPLFLHICRAVVKNNIVEISCASCEVQDGQTT